MNTPVIPRTDNRHFRSVSVILGIRRSHIRNFAVIAAGAKSEEVNPTIVGRRNVFVAFTDNVILVLGELPRVGARLILQVTLRELNGFGAFFVDRELAFQRSGDSQEVARHSRTQQQEEDF